MAGAVARMARAIGARALLIGLRSRSRKTRYLLGDQVALRVDRDAERVPDPREAKELWGAVQKSVRRADAILLSDYGKGALSDSLVGQIIRLAEGLGVPTLVDPARGREFTLYRGAALLKCAAAQWEADVGRGTGEQAGPRGLGPETALVVTCGDSGLRWRRPHELTWKSESAWTSPKSPRGDAVGAGDMTLAALGAAIASRVPLEDACRLAVVAAGLKCGRRGATPVSRQEILEQCHDETARL